MRRRSTAEGLPRRDILRRATRCEAESGSAAVELTLLTPLLIVLMLFVVAAGRVTSARITVQDAAQQAARTLTLHPGTSISLGGGSVGDAGGGGASGGAGVEQARAAAVAATEGLPCQNLTMTVHNPAAPGGNATPGTPTAGLRVVTVQVACTVDLGNLTGLGLPASTVIRATATSPRDRYRSGP